MLETLNGQRMAKKSITERSDADRRARQCERLARLLQTLHLISGKGRWDANALAAELECSRRTVHRLLQTLSMAGVPWYFDDKLKAYQIRPGFKFPLVENSSNEPSDKDSDEANAHRLLSLADRLIEDGEAFAQSLQQFLAELAAARKTR